MMAVRWYLRCLLSLRDVEGLFAERGLSVDRTAFWRWVRRYAPELEQRLRVHRHLTNDSWRVDEIYVRVKGKWVRLYQAMGSSGASSTSRFWSSRMLRPPSASGSRCCGATITRLRA